ncbi:hypothetical protein COOONC_05048 [Cooperia oncophora]
MRVCMQLTHSMLRTGAFSKCGPLLKKLSDDIIVPCLSTKNSQVYVWALEASGLLATLDEALAKSVFIKADEGFQSDDEELQVMICPFGKMVLHFISHIPQISAIDVLTDLIAVYGYNEVVSWRRGRGEGDEETESTPFFVDFLLDIIKSKVCHLFDLFNLLSNYPRTFCCLHTSQHRLIGKLGEQDIAPKRKYNL